MSTVDRRIALRRRQVAEDHARGRLHVVIWGIVISVVIGGMVWAAQSPLLDVDRIDVSGVSRSSVPDTLSALEVAPGLPLVAVRAGAIEEALESDPWVADALVTVVWPNRVEVQVAERVPIAVLTVGGSTWLVATDGVILAAGNDDGYASVRVEVPFQATPGVTVPAAVEGAIEFTAALDPGVADSSVVTVASDGLAAVVAGYPVRLGAGSDLAEKARVASALVATEPPAGSIIDVLAPSRPVIIAPATDS